MNEKPHKTGKRILKENIILKSATDVFVKKGYELATTKEIAAKANCAEGLIFKYFSGKANLLSKLLENGLHNAEEELFKIPEKPESLEDDLKLFMDWTVRVYWTQRDFFQIFFAQLLNGSNDLFIIKQREEFLKKRRDVFISRLKKHQERGVLSLSLDYEVVYMAINSFAIYQCIILPTFTPIEETCVYKNSNEFIKVLSTSILLHKQKINA